MLQQLRFCIYKGKINVKLPNAFKCLIFNVLYIRSVHFLLNLEADAKTYLFPRFMTESSQREIFNNSMLKIQYKHESLIFFLLEEKQDNTVFSNIMQCSWTEWLSVWSTLWIIQPFPICRVYICAIFPISEGSSPILKTLLWSAIVMFRFCSVLCVENIVWKKNTVGGTRNDPFGYSNTSNIFALFQIICY